MILMVPVLLLALSQSGRDTDALAACLPKGIALSEAMTVPSPAGGDTKPLTVRDTLTHLNARCRAKKLVDRAGKEIRFYRLIGCWGNPPEDYVEQQARQTASLRQLRKKYTVVEIPCTNIGRESR